MRTHHDCGEGEGAEDDRLSTETLSSEEELAKKRVARDFNPLGNTIVSKFMIERQLPENQRAIREIVAKPPVPGDDSSSDDHSELDDIMGSNLELNAQLTQMQATKSTFNKPIKASFDSKHNKTFGGDGAGMGKIFTPQTDAIMRKTGKP